MRIRELIPADLDAVDRLRAQAGWNQTRRDWLLFLSLAGDGCFLAEWDGQPAGCVTAIPLDADHGWIGMMLVDESFRRRGIGTRLLERAMEHLKASGITHILLDATPLGQRLYEQHQFVAGPRLARWAAGSRPDPAPIDDAGLRAHDEADLDAIIKLDAEAFGLPRPALLRGLAKRSTTVMVHESGGMVDGFAMMRDGARAGYLGPIVAGSPDVGRSLLMGLLEPAPRSALFWDIPEANTVAGRLASGLGFEPQRPLVRMVHGPGPVPGDMSRYFAIAGPDVG